MTYTRRQIQSSNRTAGRPLALAAAGLVLIACMAPSGASETGETSDIANTGVLEGRVTDAVTGRPVAGAEISVQGARFSTTTSSDGAYRLNRLPAGTFRGLEVRTRLLDELALAAREHGVTNVELEVPRELKRFGESCGFEVAQSQADVLLMRRRVG